MIKCRVCGSENNSIYAAAIDLNQGKSAEKFIYYRCNECNSTFISSVPENLNIYYDQDYPAYKINKPRRQELLIEKLEKSKLNLVKHYAPRGRLVEVGPASGRFLKIASETGYVVSGIEQDSKCVSHIRNVLDIEVTHTDEPASALLNVTADCDVIVAWHVIEHLADPQKFLVAVSKALRKPDGLVFISAPNPAALSFKVFGRYWVHLDAPRHLTLIPPKTLDKLMGSLGLERVECIFNDPVGLQLNKIGWISSSMNLSQNKLARWALLRWIGRILHLVMLPIERANGNGAAYTAIYKNSGAVSQNN